MYYIFEEEICPKCNFNEVRQGCQVHDVNGEYHTKKWYEEHPGVIIPGVQKAMACNDPTDFTCSRCEHQFTYEEADGLSELIKQINSSGPFRVKDSVGMGIINPNSLKKLSISSK